MIERLRGREKERENSRGSKREEERNPEGEWLVTEFLS